MDIGPFFPGDRAGLEFDEFYDATSPALWRLLTKQRARRFHGGRWCPQLIAPGRGVLFGGAGVDACHEDCVSTHHEIILQLWKESRRVPTRAQSSTSTGATTLPGLSQVAADRRFCDAVRTAGHHLHGHLTRPKRTVEDSRWIHAALDGSPARKRLLIEVLRYVQSDDPPEAGSAFPWARFAARLGRSEEAVTREVEEVIERLGNARPAWVERYIHRPLSRRLACHGADLAQLSERLAAPDMGDDDAGTDQHGRSFARDLFVKAARRVQAGIDPARALAGVVAEQVHPEGARRARGASDWPALVAYVVELAAG